MSMTKVCFLLFASLLLIKCSNKTIVLKGDFRSSTPPPSPDYSKPEYWAALPFKKDAADSVPLKSHLENKQVHAQADVFFVYPTIFTQKPKNQYTWNADVNDVGLNNQIQRSTILNQATIFNGSCRIYAPYYRQAHVYAFHTPNIQDAQQALDFAYQDVKMAFEFYLAHYNDGRPIVLASHSQGTMHCERLLKEYFDGKELQKQLVAAYLIGRAIKPDAFNNIRESERPGHVGTFVSWNTFSKNFYPESYNRYFKGSVSTNPLLWSSSLDFAPKELNKGGVALHFTYAPQLADAQNHESLLWINKPYFKGRFFLRTKTWHRADMNFYYLNIRENVALQIENFLKGNKSVSTN